MKSELTFGDRLKKIRMERNLSQEELSVLLGTSKQVISRYETNQRTPKITVVREFAEKLNVSLSYLMAEEEDRMEPSRSTTEEPKKKISLLCRQVEEMDSEDREFIENMLESTIENYLANRRKK